MVKKRTPTEAVKLFCKKSCCCGVQSVVKSCNGKVLFSKKVCPLLFYRLGKGRISVKTIRQHCLNFCMNGSREAVRECHSENCELHPFRMGTNPNYGKDRKLKSKLAKKQGLSVIGLKSRAKKKVK
jgi:hypothetical protein